MFVYGEEDGWIRFKQIAEALVEATEDKNEEHIIWLYRLQGDLIDQMSVFTDKK